MWGDSDGDDHNCLLIVHFFTEPHHTSHIYDFGNLNIVLLIELWISIVTKLNLF